MCDTGHGPSRRSILGWGAAGAAALLAGCGMDKDSGASASGSPAGSSSSADGSASDTGSATPSASPSTSATAVTATPAQMLSRATVPVLCYHQVREWESGDTEYNKGNLIIPPKNLSAQLDGIAQAGYTVIGPDAYFNYLQTGQGLPAKPVMISFDDGKDNQIQHAMPIVRDHKMTATFFIMTVILGSKGWLGKDDVKRLVDAGMTIGSHTWDHHMVTKYSGTDWATQFEKPRETLRKLSGQEVLDFAYPYGAWNTAALPHLQKAGYRAAYQLQEKGIDHTLPQYTLRRILAVSTWTGEGVVKALAKV